MQLQDWFWSTLFESMFVREHVVDVGLTPVPPTCRIPNKHALLRSHSTYLDVELTVR